LIERRQKSALSPSHSPEGCRFSFRQGHGSLAAEAGQPRRLEAFATASDPPQSPGHPFYTALNWLPAKDEFDSFVEDLCAWFYAGVMGRPCIIAWRCAESRSLAEFLGLGPADEAPEHSSISKTHKPLPKDFFDEVFQFIV